MQEKIISGQRLGRQSDGLKPVKFSLVQVPTNALARLFNTGCDCAEHFPGCREPSAGSGYSRLCASVSAASACELLDSRDWIPASDFWSPRFNRDSDGADLAPRGVCRRSSFLLPAGRIEDVLRVPSRDDLRDPCALLGSSEFACIQDAPVAVSKLNAVGAPAVRSSRQISPAC